MSNIFSIKIDGVMEKMLKCPACKHRDYAYIGDTYSRIGDDFKIISVDLGLVSCPECDCVIYCRDIMVV